MCLHWETEKRTISLGLNNLETYRKVISVSLLKSEIV